MSYHFVQSLDIPNNFHLHFRSAQCPLISRPSIRSRKNPKDQLNLFSAKCSMEIIHISSGIQYRICHMTACKRELGKYIKWTRGAYNLSWVSVLVDTIFCCLNYSFTFICICMLNVKIALFFTFKFTSWYFWFSIIYEEAQLRSEDYIIIFEELLISINVSIICFSYNLCANPNRLSTKEYNRL